MKKIFLAILMALVLVKMGIAINVATITDFGDGTIIKDCVSINSGESVYNAYKNLDKNRDDLTINFNGELMGPDYYYISSINSLGEKTKGGKYYGWNYFVPNPSNNGFADALPYGIGRYKLTKSGEVIGLKYTFTEFSPAPLFELITPPEKPVFESYGAICEKLSIEEVTAYVNGEKEVLSDGEKISKVSPKSDIKLKVKAKNLYVEDISIKDISINIKIKDIDDDADLEEESDEFDLDAGDSETKTIEFEIPLEVKDENYDMILEAKGKDNRGVEYIIAKKYSVDIKKEKHDVVIRKAELSSQSVKCSRTASLNINAANMGTNDEDVTLKIINNDLGLNKQASFELVSDPFDDDSKYTQLFTINVANDQEAGVYPILVKADYGSKTAEKTVELAVEDCKKEAAKEAKGKEAETEKKKEEKIAVSSSLKIDEFLQGQIKANASKLDADKQTNEKAKDEIKLNNPTIIAGAGIYLLIMVVIVYITAKVTRT